MDDSDHTNVRRILNRLTGLSADARAAIIDRECGDDVDLRRRVEATLATMADGDETLLPAPGGPARPALDPAPDQRAGDRLGRYHLLEQLGEGGFGTVWAAEQREPVRRRVALKIIKLGMDTKQVIARFEAERQALAMMDHPNIAKVFDAGATETGRPYFVMELVRGVPILEYCDREKLDTRQRLDLFVTVCHAIQHAHQKGIIHRDIKPDNVLVTLHDGAPVPKVIDFGIAKATNQQLTEKTIFTQQQQMIGTPAYMSPEQAEMSGLDIDTRSDIYALGVLLYELLTGTTPFEARSLLEAGFAEMMRIIREETPHKPSTRLSSLGETGTRTAERRRTDPRRLGLVLRGDLDWIVMRCLEKDRTRRYDTANGLAADIGRHLGNQPVEAGPPSASYRLRKFVRRNRGQVAAGGLLVAALVLGVIGTSVGMARANAASVRAETEATRANEEAARATRELTRAVEIKRVITQMLQSVDPSIAQLQDTTLLRGILDDASARLTAGEIDDELIAAELHHLIGDVYRRLGRLDEADAHLPTARDIRTRILGEEHPDTLASASDVATLRDGQGRLAEAESIHLDVLALRQRVLGDDHPSTLATMEDLAALYSNQGRSDEAESLLLEVLDTTRTLGAVSILGRVYGNQGRHAEAEPLLVEALEVSRGTLGEMHPTTIRSLGIVAAFRSEHGRIGDATPLLEEALRLSRLVMPEDHPETLGAIVNLAVAYSRQSRFTEAAALLSDVLDTRRRTLGEEHPDTLSVIVRLGNVYNQMGRFDDTVTVLEAGLPIIRRVSGPAHPWTLESVSALAVAHAGRGRYERAEELHLEGLESRRRSLGEEHPSTLGSMTNLATFYLQLQRYEDAASLLEISVEAKRRVLGTQHPWFGYAAQGLALAYLELDREDDARPVLEALLEHLSPQLARPDAPPTSLGTAAWVLTRDIEGVRDADQAIVYARQACALEEAGQGGRLLQYLGILASAEQLAGDSAAAIETVQRALALLAPDHPQRPEYLALLAEYQATLDAASGE